MAFFQAGAARRMAKAVLSARRVGKASAFFARPAHAIKLIGRGHCVFSPKPCSGQW
jgi:hypothetical protein